jgi:hypothetical protein
MGIAVVAALAASAAGGAAAKIRSHPIRGDELRALRHLRREQPQSTFVFTTELPDCRCTAEMNLVTVVPVRGGDTEIRTFRCPDCNHELRLTAWQDDAA